MPNTLIATDKAQLYITDIVNISELEALFQSYSDITGMATALLDLEGEVLIATNWQDSCTQFHRANETTSRRCHESDTALAGALGKGEKYTAYHCRNGLVDIATPVVIEGVHMANFFTGQFFYAKPDLEYFSQQAENVGFEKEAYLDAISRVPVYDEATIKEHMNFLVRLAELVGKMGASNLKTLSAKNALETHKSELEAQVEERTKQLHNSLKKAESANEAKSKFLTNMTHELRTPLHAVLGFSEILETRESDEKKKGYLKAINSAGNGLLSLINSVLDLSKIESGKMPVQLVPVSLVSLLEELRSIFIQLLSEKDLEIKMQIADDVPSVINFDEDKLRQVLINLKSNAIKFTDEGYVKISVCVSAHDKEANTVSLEISVIDTGIGIGEEDQEKIFTAFEQAKGQNISEHGGTGIGLSLVKNLVDIMGGELRLDSKLGEGSRFICSFPDVSVLPIESLHENSTSNPLSERVHFKHSKILVVDDNAVNRDLMQTYLSDWDFEITMAENGRQAIALAREIHPDLILMDMKMPVMDGYQASQLLKEDEQTKDIPVVAATASALSQQEQKIRQICDDYLRKPIKRKALIGTLRRFLPVYDAQQKRKVESVLIVDDLEMNRVLLADMLSDYEHLQVFEASSGEEALALFADKIHPDVILMDFQMPGLNGVETTERVREIERKNGATPAKIYLVTALNSTEIEKNHIESVFDGTVTKPFEMEDIERVVFPVL